MPDSPLPEHADVRSIVAQLNDIFRDVFESDDLVIGLATTADDVAGWDSLTHVTLILRVERSFGIRLSSAEVADMQSVGDLTILIRQHRSGI